MITLNNVFFAYKGTEENSLRDVSLHIPRGQCVLLCGPSGCGKTTLTRLLNGLIPDFFDGDFTGEAEVKGINIAKADILQLSEVVGTVFQNPRTQFFNTDADSEIVFGLENRGLPTEQLASRLEQVTEDLGLRDLRGRSIFELSGGEKQKIAFASVYAAGPEVFVLDEPSSNLDYQSIKELKRLIQKIKTQGKTIVIAEHRIWYLMDIADRVILMGNGQITGDMNISEFNQLAQIRQRKLRCRNLSEVKAEAAGAAMGKYRFEVTGLSVKLGHKTVLRNISFKAAGGEIIAITGENGAGKTTLARVLCGLEQEETGQIAFDGRTLSGKARREKSYLVMQDVGHQLFTDSVDAECRLGIKKDKEPFIDRTLAALSLAALKDRHPLSLSGGQKQRLAVAVSLLCGKEVLIFDEPTSGLDLSSMEEVGNLIKKLAADHKIILIMTHDIEFIKTICSRVLILSQGEMTGELDGEEKGELEKYLK